MGDRASHALDLRTIAAGDRERAARTWQALEARLPDPGLTCGWAWTSTWLEHYGDVVPHRFVVATAGGREVGAALVTESAARFPPVVGVRVASVGTAGEPRGAGTWVERNRLLVEPAQRDPFAAALLAHLGRDRRWDRLDLPGLVADDAAAFRRADPGLAADEHDSPVHLLGAGDPLDALGAGVRRRVRKALEAVGPLETDWAADDAGAVAMLAELVELHQRRWRAAGEPGAFGAERFVAFHRTLVTRLGPGRGAILVRVRSGPVTLGCVYGQVEAGRVLFYQSGLARRDGVNVGLAVHLCAMRACAAHGLVAYDFLAPAARYKRELSTAVEPLVWLTRDRRRVRVRIDGALRRLQRGR